MEEQQARVMQLRVRPLYIEAEALAEIIIAAFEEWIVVQPNWGGIWSDYEEVNAALEESYAGSYREASAAAFRLAGVASRGPYASQAVSLFDSLAVVWMLDGGAWRERRCRDE